MTSPILILHADDEKIIFSVPASNREDEPYIVTYDFDDGWLCTCPGCIQGGHFCRHMYHAKKFMEYLQSNLLADDHEVFTGVEV